MKIRTTTHNDLALVKFLIQTTGHVWTASELLVIVGCSKSALYRALQHLKDMQLVVTIGDTYSFNAELLGSERNITILRKNLRKTK